MEYFRDEKNSGGVCAARGQAIGAASLNKGVHASERYDSTLAICNPAIALNQLLGANRGNEGISEGNLVRPRSGYPNFVWLRERNTFSDPPELTNSVFI